MIWFAHRCATHDYTTNRPGEILDVPFTTKLIKIADIDTKSVPEDLFTLKATVPGTSVTDHTDPDSARGKDPVHYTIPARPEDLDRVIGEARAQARGEAGWSVFKIALLVGNTLALAALLIYVSLRYLKKVHRP